MENRELISYNTYHGKDAGQLQDAYLTVCLALCLAVILSLFLVLLDGVRRNGARLEAEIVAEVGLQSILAEYHRGLMEQYNLFAIDASYGTDLCSIANTEAHLRNYLKKNVSYDDIFLSGIFYRDFLALTVEQAELRRASILTDDGGAVFRKCAVEAIKADIGLELLAELQGWMQTVEANGLESGNEEQRKQELDEELAEWVSEYDGTEIETEEGETATVELYNPTESLEIARRRGILRLVLGSEATLSNRTLRTDNLIMERLRRGQVNRGNMEQEALEGAEQLAEKFAFQEYLLRYMGRYGQEHEEDALRYQIEYLIAGKESDVENLRSVANRLCLLREAANAMYLASDSAKRGEIKTAATLICALILQPELLTVMEGVILLAWAYAESIYDVKTLLAGGKAPLLKNRENWHYTLTAALQGGLQDQTQEGSGLSYQDYLRIFLMSTSTDTLTGRAMNMVEADIRKVPGNLAFRLDGCYDALEALIRIGSRYGYQYEITRQKSYH